MLEDGRARRGREGGREGGINREGGREREREREREKRARARASEHPRFKCVYTQTTRAFSYWCMRP